MNFYILCDQFLQDLGEEIEKRDVDSNLEIDYSDGILNITICANSKIFVINRNSGNQKIWYSSPFSGANYFSYDNDRKQFISNLNQELTEFLIFELKDYLTKKI
jgi:iron donor protein CyaY